MANENGRPVGDRIKEERVAAGLSVPELAARIFTLSQSDPDIESVDRTSLLRIESGVTQRPRDSTLRAIGLALGKPPAFFIVDAGPARLNICAPHAIFSAPAIIAALTSTIEGAYFTTFGAGAPDEAFKPEWISLSANGERKLKRPEPPEEVADAVLPEAIPGMTTWAPETAPASDRESAPVPPRTVTAARIIELWKQDEIDVAVISAEVFKQHAGTMADAVHCCTLTHNSGRGVRLIALYDPERVDDSILKTEFPTGTVRRVAKREYSNGQIVVPASTFATHHVEQIDTPEVITSLEIPIGNYDEFRKRVFEQLESASNNGLVIVALWEPFVTFLREQWLDWVQTRSAISTADWRECSLTDAIDTQGLVGLPTLSMDVLIRRRYLDEAGGVPIELEYFLAQLEKVTVEIEAQGDLFRKFVSFLTSVLGDDVAQYFKGKMAREIRLLALYFGISEYRCARAIARVGFEIGYAPAYVQYLKRFIWRRSGGREGARVRMGEAA